MGRMSNTAPNGIVPDFTLGDRLRKARESAGLSTEQMSEILEVTSRTVRNYETESTPIKRSALIAWALATGVSFAWIVSGEAAARPDPDPRGGDLSTKWQTAEADVYHLDAHRILTHSGGETLKRDAA